MKWALFLSCTLIFSRSFSQNLIPNNGFELVSSCPVNNYGEIYKLKNWYDWTVSADFYSCFVGVPTNLFGYQFPNSGSGYIGFGYAERVAVKLTQSLEAGKSYQFEMYVSAGTFNNYASQFAVILSKDSLCELSKSYTSHYLTTGSPMMDTVNWVLLSTTFTANGCEKYLGLDIPFTTYTYYFFDDVSLQCVDTAGCVPPLCAIANSAYIPNIFSPNKDGVNDEFRVTIPNTELSNFHCRVYNRWGEEVIQLNHPTISWDGKNRQREDVPDGVYYFFLEYTITECGEWYSDQGYLHLVR